VKKFRRNLQGTFVTAPSSTPIAPQAEQESILGQFLLGGRDFEVYLEKRSSTFLRRKVNPSRQNPGYAYRCSY